MTDRPALLVMPNEGSHQGEYLLWVVRAWAATRRGRPLVVAAPRSVFEREPRLTSQIAATGGAVRAADFPPDAPGSALANLLALHRWDPLAALVGRERPSDAVLMSFDHFVAPLAARRPLPAPTRLHALTLRPTLHYAEIGSPARGGAERARRLAKRTVTAAALRHPALRTVLTLDPTATEPLARLGPARAVPVLDPVPEGEPTLDPAAVRASLGVPADRVLVVLPGRVDERKGAPVLFDAVAQLPDEVARRLAVVVAGRIALADRGPFDASAERAGRRAGVVVCDERLDDGALASFVAAADLVALPYDRHVGSSGFLLRAAGAGVPVLTQSYGLMGHLVRRHRLGWETEVTRDALARTLAVAAADPRAPFDPEAARRFARVRTPDAFAAPFLEVLDAP